MKKTYKELFDFVSEANVFVKELKEKERETKSKVAVVKMIGDAEIRKPGILSENISDYYEKVDELRVEHASTDDKGNILRDAAKELMFTKAKDKELKIALKELNKKETEFTPVYSTDLIEADFTEYQKDLFKGFIIPEDYVFGPKTLDLTPENTPAQA